MKKNLLLFVGFLFSLQVNAQTAIQEFNFDGNLSNTDKTISFNGVVKYVNDRSGVANKAIRIHNTTLEAIIGNLPLSNAKRSVSIWLKYNTVASANYIWGYGSLTNAQYYGLLQQGTTTSSSDLNLAGWGPANDVIVTTSISPDTWYNYTVTYDGLTSRIYRNGELIKSSISPRKLTSALVFSIGKMGDAVSINADIDDLKIYNVALTGEEVSALYNNSSALSPDKPIVAPNNQVSKTSSKITNVLVEKDPLESNVKSTEIYSTQGLKVLTGSTNKIDVTNLPEGTYLLKVKKSETATVNKLTVND
ncbi:LamG domain-containing protein [Flavobacterium adhaerens]|uniref:LamG domain-containing protein n=1 Tax=Flavobacterium adhaerens TaxID=3149043 RepID=UPI0032B5E84B